MSQTLPAILQTDPLRFIDMTEVLRRGSATLLADRPDGALLYEQESRAYMMTATSMAAAEAMLATLESADLFVAHEAFYLPLLGERLRLALDMECRQAAYLRPALPAAPPIPYAIRPAAPADLPAILRLYEHDLGPDYFADRIRRGALFSVYDGDTLAAFAGFHPEGAMGMLEVDPAYRRRHIGEALTAFLIAHQRAQGRVPFSQVVLGNEASLRMHEKMGFAMTEESLYWMAR